MTAKKDAVMSVVRSTFKPEFLNRLDDIILFDPLSTEELTKIVDLQIARLARRLERSAADAERDAGGQGVAGGHRIRPGVRRPAAAQADPVRDRRQAGAQAAGAARSPTATTSSSTSTSRPTRCR